MAVCLIFIKECVDVIFTENLFTAILVESSLFFFKKNEKEIQYFNLNDLFYKVQDKYPRIAT